MRSVLSRPRRIALFAGVLLVLLAGTARVMWGDEAVGGNAPEVRRGEPVELFVLEDGRWRPVSTQIKALRSLWVRGCIRGGEGVAFCRCAIDEYATRLRQDEFDAATAVALSGGTLAELPGHVRDVIDDIERECP